MIFSYSILGLTQSPSFPLNDMDGFYQLIAGSHKSDRPNIITGNDKIQLKRDYFGRSVMNGIRPAVLNSSADDSPPGHKIFTELKINFFEKVKKIVLSHIYFFQKRTITNLLILIEKQ